MNTETIIQQFSDKFIAAKQQIDTKFANFNQGLSALVKKYQKAWEHSLQQQEQAEIDELEAEIDSI